MKKILFLFVLFIVASCHTYAQFEGFRSWYPIGNDADVQWKSSYLASETILFEANPIARYSIYNNMRDYLGKNASSRGQAYYIVFKPQLRMYTDNSRPVKMPTYRAEGGVQRLFKLKSGIKTSNFISIALESGHFSNGQAGAAFSEHFDDGSPESDSIYTLITDDTDLSALLNRKNGNFSTNLTEAHVNFRKYRFTSAFSSTIDRAHSVTLGVVYYHNNLLGLFDIGGFTKEDIKIYGRFRYQLNYEYTHVLANKPGKQRTNPQVKVAEMIELIQGGHASVNPFRSETRISFKPGSKRSIDFAFFAGFIYGHDNYNYRFVDDGSQFMVGFCWSPSSLPYIERASADIENNDEDAATD